jgi:hypothetical protein
LIALADGVSRDEWSRASESLALLANVNRDPKKRRKPFVPGDFSPYPPGPGEGGKAPSVRPGSVLLTAANIDILKTVFIDQKGS